jgi:hypothetical protein
MSTRFVGEGVADAAGAMADNPLNSPITTTIAAAVRQPALVMRA